MFRIAAWFAVGDGKRDRGEVSRVIELGRRCVKIKRVFKTESLIPVGDIISVDAWREPSPASKRQRAMSNAIAGGLLFGRGGALMGMAATGNYAWFGEIVTDSKTAKFRFQNEHDSKAFLKWWEKRKVGR